MKQPAKKTKRVPLRKEGNAPVPKRRLKNATAECLSLVPRGANKLVTLYKEDGTFSLDSLVKADALDEKGELLAVAYAPEMRDAQGDIASAAEVKKLAHSFAKNGAKLDLRHDGKPIDKKRAYVAETFVVAKGDKRFEGWKDYAGQPADLTDAWAVVVKIDDPELRKLYKAGAWNGVSFEGKAELVLEKEGPATTPTSQEIHMTPEELKKILADERAATIEVLRKEFKPLDHSGTPAPAATAPVFKGDVTNIVELKKHLVAIKRSALLKGVDMNDPEQLAAAIEQLEKEAVEAQKNETPDQKLARVTKDNVELLARLKKAERTSSQAPADAAPGTPASDSFMSKEHADDATLGRTIASFAPGNRAK